GDSTIISDAEGDVCLNTIVTYTTESGQSNYVWEVFGGDILFGGGSDENFVEVMWISTEDTYVTVSYDGSNGCFNGDTVVFEETVIVCADLIITKEVDELNPIIGERITFTVTVSNLGPNDFENLVISEQIASGFSF